MMASNEYVIRDVCRENSGDHKPYFAKEHLTKHPDHTKYNILPKK